VLLIITSVKVRKDDIWLQQAFIQDQRSNRKPEVNTGSTCFFDKRVPYVETREPKIPENRKQPELCTSRIRPTHTSLWVISSLSHWTSLQPANQIARSSELGKISHFFLYRSIPTLHTKTSSCCHFSLYSARWLHRWALCYNSFTSEHKNKLCLGVVREI
jgi:hypothetical protein